MIRGDSEWFGLKVDELIGIRHIWSDDMGASRPEQKEYWLGLAEQWIRMEDDQVPLLQIRSLMKELESSGGLIM